jgi:hypothetical protein
MYEQLIQKLKNVLKENLISIIKFGTEGEQNNILIITRKLDIYTLEKIKLIIIEYSKKTNVVPILFTKKGIIDGADVFPLEFLDMKYPHTILYGKDIIEKVKIQKKNVRRQLEFELRSKLIHLRENYIWIKKSKELKALLKSAIPSLMPLFYGLLYLKDVKPPIDLDSLYRNVGNIYKIDMSLFRKIKQNKIKDEQLSFYVKNLIVLLEKLISIVDHINV